MANQERSAHVSNTEHNAHWRGARPLFWSWRLRVNGLERTGNHPAFTAAGCDLRRSQGRIGAPGMVWPCGTSAAPIARLARLARSIPSGGGAKDPAIRIRQRDVPIPVLITHVLDADVSALEREVFPSSSEKPIDQTYKRWNALSSTRC